jgi:uncharacterized protein YegL
MVKKKVVTTTTVTEEIIETNDKTLIVCLLDRSGSMAGVISSAIEKFNEFLSGQQALPDKADMTIALFDDQYELLYENVNIKKVNPITKEQWYPRGMTRLNDAIGKTISVVKNDIQKLSKKDRPDKVLFVITTDGLENDSKEYTLNDIKSLIKGCENDEWTFLYLAANQDAFQVGTSYGISAGNTFTFSNTSAGNAVMYSAVHDASTSIRGASVGTSSYNYLKKNLLTKTDEDEGVVNTSTTENKA